MECFFLSFIGPESNDFFFKNFCFVLCQRFRNYIKEAKTRLGCRWADEKDTHTTWHNSHFKNLFCTLPHSLSCLGSLGTGKPDLTSCLSIPCILVHTPHTYILKNNRLTAHIFILGIYFSLGKEGRDKQGMNEKYNLFQCLMMCVCRGRGMNNVWLLYSKLFEIVFFSLTMSKKGS